MPPSIRRRLALVSALLVSSPAVASLHGSPGSRSGPGGPTSPPAEPPPNVVIYLVDTLRADHLGIYGYRRDTSPVLDRWAAGGVVFDRAYAPSSWTKPSMVSLLSGLDTVTHGVEDRLDVIPDGVRLLSEQLKSNGYATLAAVTNPNVLPHWGFGRGFDVYDDLDSAGHGTRADTVSDWVAERMDELARSQPFLLYLHVLDPHAPYDPPAPFDTRFPESPDDEPIGRYDGEVAFVDSQFGRVVDSLASRGLDARTMTIFVADHGEELLDHGSFGHGPTLFEEVVRVPLVIRFPGGAHAGARVQARASLSDVMPTVMSAVGLPPPDGVDGRDLTELLSGDAPPWADRELFLSVRTTGPHSNLVRAVLSGPHKYVRRSRPVGSESLYDLQRDPAETENLANEETDAHERLAATLEAYLAVRSRGIHLRIVSDFPRRPVGCEARLRTTGRFVGVSGVRLEPADRFELSGDGRELRLDCRLENRHQSTLTGARLVPDEDGIVFLVDPPEASVVVQQLRLEGGGALPLRAGAGRAREAVPFTFEATDASWSVGDVDDLLADAAWAPGRNTPEAYLGVVHAPTESPAIPRDLLDRLRALGYVNDTGGFD